MTPQIYKILFNKQYYKQNIFINHFKSLYDLIL